MNEPESDAIHSLLTGAGSLAACRTSEVEVVSALARRCREGAFPPEERDRAIHALRKDLASFFIVELTGKVVSKSIELLTRHPLRAADAIQLAAFIELHGRLRLTSLFIACDARLIEAARSEGFETAP